jgi:hypothetical protein
MKIQKSPPLCGVWCLVCGVWRCVADHLNTEYNYEEEDKIEPGSGCLDPLSTRDCF